MAMRRFGCLVLVALAVASPARADMGDPDVAALQVALHARGLYGGPIDGVLGEATTRAVRKFQRRARIVADGIPGPQTQAAIGPFARRKLGSRLIGWGMSGWDVAALQFLLAWHGFALGPLDGAFGDRTAAALLRFQQWAGLPSTATAGPLTLAALRGPPPRSPIRLEWPLVAPLGDPFGPRGNRFHAGLDLPAPTGTAVEAAAAGLVVSAGWALGGWGYQVTIDHGGGVRTLYAHLSRVSVSVGTRVSAAAIIGRVGSTGHSSGPHLHLELRLRGAAVDPLTGLPS